MKQYLNKIIHADCMDVLKELPDKCVDLVVTSPPYNLVREASGGYGGSHPNDAKYGSWYDDDMPEDEYQSWQREVLTELTRVCRGSIFYNHKVRYAWSRRGAFYHPIHWIGDFEIWNEIIWDRCGTTAGNVPKFFACEERIYQIQKPVVWHNPKGYTNIWRISPDKNSKHVCPFPAVLVARCITTCTDENMIVLDPFSGSGTVSVVADGMNRNFICIEKDKDYHAASVKRLEDHQRQGKLF